MRSDEERGLVFGVVFFDHAGTLKTVTLKNGTTFQVPAVYRKPTTLMVAELFKIKAGQDPQDRRGGGVGHLRGETGLEQLTPCDDPLRREFR